ncbi:MAG TPA: hypothetical protein VM368_09530 [Flavisolibacter sp.]|nr:hypothetical protein [Flavisolibacter sp.]
MKYNFILLVVIASLQAFSQPNSNPLNPKITAKWAPTGLLVGSASFQAEYNFGGKHSLTANIGLPVNVQHSFTYDGRDAFFDMKATSFLAGYRTYLSRKRLAGLYLEPFFKYVHHTSEGEGTGTLDNQPVTFDFSNEYNAVGVGLQLGAQFLISKRIVIDLFFLGPEINSAQNTLRAIERSTVLQWNAVEAKEAEDNIREFINQFPFIRNKTNVMVDQNNRTVTADFKGALPGFRAGISLGLAF